ncbi:MAG: hypothetical protein ACE5G8_11115 [Anaerolineae bacterium]
MAKKKKSDKSSGVTIGDIHGNLSGNIAGRDIKQQTITAGAGSVIGSSAGGNIVTGSNVNIGSTLTNVTQQVGALAQAGPDDKAELEALLKQLEAALKELPAGKQEEAELVAEYTQELVAEAGKETPKKTRLQISGQGLKKAAETLLDVAPLVGEIAGKIVMKILMLGG